MKARRRRLQAVTIMRFVLSSIECQCWRSSLERKQPRQYPLGPDSQTPMQGLGISKNSSCCKTNRPLTSSHNVIKINHREISKARSSHQKTASDAANAS